MDTRILYFIGYIVISLLVLTIGIYFRKRCVVVSIVLISADVVMLILSLLRIKGLI